MIWIKNIYTLLYNNQIIPRNDLEKKINYIYIKYNIKYVLKYFYVFYIYIKRILNVDVKQSGS